MSDCIPTPFWISAENAMSGAIDHRRKETRFGLTFPLVVSTRYQRAPMDPMIVPIMTKYDGNIVSIIY